jgi:pSer/pThr/pTyr-binding forkhead associated (FHA) protein
MPPGARWEYPLRGESTLIGRQGGQLPVDLDIGFYDPEGYVSRNHARITVTQRRYQITDLGSSNGTFVNEKRLTPHVPRLLSHGDQIRLGRVVLAFRMR